MAIQTIKRTTVSFTRADLRNIAQLQKRENIQTLAAVLRWAVNEALKGRTL